VAKAALRLIGRTRICANAPAMRPGWSRCQRAGNGPSRRDWPSTMESLRRLAWRTRQRVLPSSALGKACDYLLLQWSPLSAHLRHGESRLDNNLVENAIRPSCIGKRTGCSSATPTPASAPPYPLLADRLLPAPRQGPLCLPARHPHPAATHDQPGRYSPLLTPARWQPASACTFASSGNHCDVTMVTIPYITLLSSNASHVGPRPDADPARPPPLQLLVSRADALPAAVPQRKATLGFLSGC
jgi:hypothetical protein